MSIFSKVITSMFGRKSDKDLKILEPIVKEINDLFVPLEKLTNKELRRKGLRNVQRKIRGRITE